MADLLKSKRLREDRAPLAKQIRDMADLAINENREFTPEETETWEKVNDDYNAMTRSIELAERAERVTFEQEEPVEERDEPPQGHRTERLMPGREDVRPDPGREDREQVPTEEDRSLALQAWVLAQLDKPLQQRHKAAAKLCGVRPHAAHFDVSLRKDYRKVRAEKRALSSIIGSAGAATIPEGFVNNLEIALLAFGGMREVADVMRTESGNELPWPTTNDTSNEGALIGENTQVGTQDVEFAQVRFYAYKYTSKLVQVPVELLEDSAFDVASILGQMLGERISRRTNRDFTVGDGASKPWGIVTKALVGKTTASATSIAADEIFDLIHSVDPSYRSNARFMMHDNILLAVRKLKDGSGQYLWQSGLQMGEPDRLLGYPITINQHMASAVTTGARTILFGALDKYKIRDVAGFRMRRLVERYADSDQEGFVAFSRHDGNLLDAGTGPVKALVQA